MDDYYPSYSTEDKKENLRRYELIPPKYNFLLLPTNQELPKPLNTSENDVLSIPYGPSKFFDNTLEENKALAIQALDFSIDKFSNGEYKTLKGWEDRVMNPMNERIQKWLDGLTEDQKEEYSRLEPFKIKRDKKGKSMINERYGVPVDYFFEDEDLKEYKKKWKGIGYFYQDHSGPRSVLSDIERAEDVDVRFEFRDFP